MSLAKACARCDDSGWDRWQHARTAAPKVKAIAAITGAGYVGFHCWPSEPPRSLILEGLLSYRPAMVAFEKGGPTRGQATSTQRVADGVVVPISVRGSQRRLPPLVRYARVNRISCRECLGGVAWSRRWRI
jgi:hypothetical protein